MSTYDEPAQDHRLGTEDILAAGRSSHEHDDETTSQAVPGFDRDGEDTDRDDLNDVDRDDVDDLGGEGSHAETANPDRVDSDALDTKDADERDTDTEHDGARQTATGDVDRDGSATPAATGDTTAADEPATADDSPAAGATTVEPAAGGTVPTGAKPTPTTAANEENTPLFADGEVEQFRTQWRELQSAFVDSPQQAVQEADELVAQIMQNLAATFAEHKRTLETQWHRDGEAETEDLRLALRQYRSFFNLLLSV